MTDIDISNISKASVLAALFNASRPQGLGFLHYQEGDMTVEVAEAILASGQTYFDYVQGRVLKIDLSGNTLNPSGYDRDNGDGSAARVIDSLRETNDASNAAIKTLHEQGRADAAPQAHVALGGGDGADGFVGRYLPN